MKSIATIIVLLLSFFQSQALESKTLKIQKNFDINENGRVKINSSYGEIKYETWDKNQVQITVYITVNGTDIEKIDAKINSISIEFDNTPNEVSAKTIFNKSRYKGMNASVNYEIMLPKTNSIFTSLNYGKIILGNHLGDIDINANYSDFISNYNQKNINLSCNYSHGDFKDCKKLNISANYCEFKANQVNELKINTNYTDTRIQKIEDRIQSSLTYSELKIMDLDPKFEDIRLQMTYSDVDIYIQKNTGFNFTGSRVYGDFELPKNFNYSSNATKKHNSSITGSYGNNGSNITASGTYSDLKIIEN